MAAPDSVEIGRKLRQHDNELEAVYDLLKRVDGKVDALDTRVSKLDAGFAQLNTRVSKLETKVDVGFAQLNTRVDKLETRFDTLAVGFEQLQEGQRQILDLLRQRPQVTSEESGS